MLWPPARSGKPTLRRENLARYIIQASFSQERLTYLPEESRIIYRSKDNRQEKAFDALDWPCPVK